MILWLQIQTVYFEKNTLWEHLLLLMKFTLVPLLYLLPAWNGNSGYIYLEWVIVSKGTAIEAVDLIPFYT